MTSDMRRGDVCGIDEAGRGALAGPVAAGAVQLGKHYPADRLLLLQDSKALTAAERTERAGEIVRHAARWAVAWATSGEVDRYNVLQATLLAMRRAYLLLFGGRGLESKAAAGVPTGPAQAQEHSSLIASRGGYACEPQGDGRAGAVRIQPRVIVDGPHAPRLDTIVEAIIKADASVPAVQAASILAKTHRDAWMIGANARFPQYGFAQHKGYPTAQHKQMISRHGRSPIHRRSFRVR